MIPRARRLLGRFAWGVLAAYVASGLVPSVWSALDPRLSVSACAGRQPRGAVVGMGVVYYYEQRPGRDPWGRPFHTPARTFDEDGVERRDYSAGPNGVFERGAGDDVLLLDELDPRLRLYQQSGLLAASTVLGAGGLLLLLFDRRTLLGIGRFLSAGLGASSVAALGFAAVHALAQVAPAALPPYPVPALVATAALGGGLAGHALASWRAPEPGGALATSGEQPPPAR